MADSLLLADTIELMAGGQQITAGPAAGATIRLGKDYQFGQHESQTLQVESALLDGDPPTGDRSGNRTIVLPLEILGRRAAIYAARELLVSLVDQRTFDLVYQPEGMPGTSFSCFRAKVTIPSNYLQEMQGVLSLSLEIPALPFGESIEERTIAFDAAGLVLDTMDTAPSGWTEYTNIKVQGTGCLATFAAPNVIDRHTFWAGSPKDLSTTAAISVWVRRDSTPGRRITQTYGLTLYDSHGKTYNLGPKSVSLLHGSWQQIRWTVVWPVGFDQRHATGYKLNGSGAGFVDYLSAIPASSALYNSVYGAVYDLTGIDGSVRAPVRLELNLPGNGLFQSALVHVPPADAPDGFLPVVGFNSPADGVTRATPPTYLGTKTGRRFKGTYAVYLAMPAQAGTFTVNCFQQWNDPTGQVQGSIQESLVGTITADVTAGDFRNGLVNLGTMTVPGRDMPDDNDTVSWQFAVLGSNTSAFVQDILLLDIRGSVVLCAPVQRVRKIFVDPPESTVNHGGVFAGSDREHALSISGDSIITGEAIPVHPQSSRLFVYSTDSALSLSASYLPRWYSLDPGSQPVPSDVTDPYPTLYASAY